MADITTIRSIIDAVGGEDNIKTVGHCMTRLRFTLRDDSRADDEKAKAVKGVKGISKAAGQYQMIIGTGTVDDYYDTIVENYTFGKSEYSNIDAINEIKDEKNPVFKALGSALGILSGSIAPWLGCIMGSLMITAILSLCNSLGILDPAGPTYQFFSLVSGACVYSLPVLIGFSAAEKLQTNKYMGALLGAIMIYPALMNAVSEGTVSIFGMSIRNFSYTSTILPVLLAVWLLKYVEKFAKKICPKAIYIFGVTLIELLIVVPAVYLIVGPIGVAITNAISSFVLFVSDHAGFLAAAVVGSIMPAAVMAGVHLGLFPIAALMIGDLGYDPIIHPALMVYNMSAAGSAFAYGLRSKNADDRSMGISAGISGILGISEASLFGVILPNKRVFLTTEIGIILSGIITGIVGYKTYVPLSQSIFSIPAAAHGDFNLMACVISFASALIISFVVTYLFGMEKKDEEPAENNTAAKAVSSETAAADAIVAVADGRMVDVKSVSDPVFADQMLGRSAAFRYEDDTVTLCAPASGTLSVLFPTGHAFGVTMNDGVEVLVHCGVNTVGANGEGFEVLKNQGDTVKAGDPVVRVDMKKLSQKYDMSTMVIITDSKGKDIRFRNLDRVKKGETIIE